MSAFKTLQQRSEIYRYKSLKKLPVGNYKVIKFELKESKYKEEKPLVVYIKNCFFYLPTRFAGFKESDIEELNMGNFIMKFNGKIGKKKSQFETYDIKFIKDNGKIKTNEEALTEDEEKRGKKRNQENEKKQKDVEDKDDEEYGEPSKKKTKKDEEEESSLADNQEEDVTEDEEIEEEDDDSEEEGSDESDD